MKVKMRLNIKLFYIFLSTFFVLIVSFLISINNNVFAQSRTCGCYEYPVGACVWNINECGDNWQPDCHPPCTSCTCIESTPGPNEPLNFNLLYNAIGFRFDDNSTIGDIISASLSYVFPFAGLILLVFIIIGGFKFMFSAGDPKAAQSAKGVLTTAFIGFIIIFLAYWLTRLIATILGLEQIKTIF